MKMTTKTMNHNKARMRNSEYSVPSRFSVIIPTVMCLLSFYQISFADQGLSDTIFTKTEIEQSIESPQSLQRNTAAKEILNIVDFDTTWAFHTIIHGIQVEQNYLQRSGEIGSSYVLTSFENILNYVRNLGFLGSHSPSSLKNFGENLPPDQKIWVLIARGYQKDETVHDRLREIAAGKGNPLQKAMAVEAISHYKDTLDIPILVDAALDNENSIDWLGGGDLPGFNPVAGAGVRALRKMGYILEWDSQEFKAILKKIEDVEINNPERGDQDE
jgi:hypothetical protein